MEGLFSFGLLFVLVLAVVVVGAAVYRSRLRRRVEDLTPERDVATPSGRPAGAAPDGTAASPTESSAPPTAPHEYEKDLGGDAHAARYGHHVAALKAYRPVGDEWHDYPPTGRRACWSSRPKTTRWTRNTAPSFSSGSRTACRTPPGACFRVVRGKTAPSATRSGRISPCSGAQTTATDSSAPP